jgi:hypothetical protein
VFFNLATLSILVLLPVGSALLPAVQLGAQEDGRSSRKKRPAVPTITERSFTAGSATVTVTGSFQIEAEIPINVQASIGSGQMTWLQYGPAGVAEPNATITVQPGELGIVVAGGKRTATAGVIDNEESECTGSTEVTATLVTGTYTCTEVTSYDQTTRKMGKVKIEIRFEAKS